MIFNQLINPLDIYNSNPKQLKKFTSSYLLNWSESQILSRLDTFIRFQSGQNKKLNNNKIIYDEFIMEYNLFIV